MSKLTIIIIEDEFLIQAEYERVISQAFPGAELFPLADSSSLLRIYKQVKPDLILTDLVMDSESEGISGITELRKIDAKIPIIVASGHGSFIDIAEAFNISLSLQKPVSEQLLVNAITKVLDVR